MFRRAVLLSFGGVTLSALLVAQDAGSRVGISLPATQSWGTAGGATALLASDMVREHGSYIRFEDSEIWCPYIGVNLPACEAVGQFQVPDGARLDQLQFWGFDSDPATGMEIKFFEICQGGPFPPTSTLLASLETFGSAGDYFAFQPLDATVDNRSCSYAARVMFHPDDAGGRDELLRLRKLALLWTRQVSPAPPFATFTDVPLDHPFSQFVEALAKSGITGGCGNVKYCPDQPLTRGQMAVFLAKGLGLSWQ